MTSQDTRTWPGNAEGTRRKKSRKTRDETAVAGNNSGDQKENLAISGDLPRRTGQAHLSLRDNVDVTKASAQPGTFQVCT